MHIYIHIHTRCTLPYRTGLIGKHFEIRERKREREREREREKEREIKVQLSENAINTSKVKGDRVWCVAGCYELEITLPSHITKLREKKKLKKNIDRKNR